MPTSRPAPSWSVLPRRTVTTRPSRVRCHVSGVQRHQLGAAEGPGEAEQQQGPVAPAGERLLQRPHHGPHVGGHCGLLAHLAGTVAAADAGQHLADGGLSGGRVEARGLVRLGDGGEAAADGRGLAVAGLRGEVDGDGLGQGRERRAVVPLAPGGEVAPVGAVGAAGVGGDGLVGVAAGPLARLAAYKGYGAAGVVPAVRARRSPGAAPLLPVVVHVHHCTLS